jgi:hypothetical protein
MFNATPGQHRPHLKKRKEGREVGRKEDGKEKEENTSTKVLFS